MDTQKTISIRIWTSIQLDTIKKQLLLIDDLYGTCANCKQLGLNYLKDKKCTGCNTQFKYIATNSKSSSDVLKILNRIQKENLPLILIDREDYNRAITQDNVKDLFKSTS